MAKLDLGSVTLDEVKSNANSSYAASISSGEIHSVVCRHSKNGNVLLVIEGKSLNCKGFDGGSFTADGCVLYNPPLVRCIVEACDGDSTPIFIVNGAVSMTAPATATTDKVQSREGLQKEKAELQAKYFSLTEAEQETAKSRIAAIEKALKTM